MRMFASRLFCCLAALGIGAEPGGAALAQTQVAQIQVAQTQLAQAEGGGSIGGSIDPAPAAAAPRPQRPRPRAQPQRQAPAPRSAERRAPARRAAGASFDGAWTVSAGGACASAGTNQVVISGRNVISQGMVTGHVSAGGAVTTLASINGLTVSGRGQIVGSSASGIYRQSDGCSGPWSAIKL